MWILNNNKALAEFIKIYELEFGVVLSMFEARKKAGAFMQLFKRIAEQKNKNGEK